MTDKKIRVIATVFYLAFILGIQYLIIGAGFPVNEKMLWLVNGIASLLLGSRLLNPHFIPPADVATNAFFAGSTMVASLAVSSLTITDKVLVSFSIALCSICFLCSITVLLAKRNQGLETRFWVLSIEKIVKGIGNPKAIFTFVIIICVWVFHRSQPKEIFAILVAWTVVVALDPIEWALHLFAWLRSQGEKLEPNIIGLVAAHQAPGLVLIRQRDEIRHPTGKLMAISDDQGPTLLGVALNYVGRDDGILLRALSLPVPRALRASADNAAVGGGAATSLEINEEQALEVKILKRINSLCGIVDCDSDLEFIQIEIVNDHDLSEGCLVDVKIRDDTVIYQVIDGVTREEAVQQKNKYGYVCAKARKIGKWDTRDKKFSPVSWLPSINSPVFIKSTSVFVHNADAIGHFPGTNYQVSVDISDAVTHNTAILGILGIGKSYLSIEMVERMIHKGIKVICLDLTDQYASLLEGFYDADYHSSVMDTLSTAAKGRPESRGKEDGGSIGVFNNTANTVISDFLSQDQPHPLLVINPSSFRVSKQTLPAFKQGDGAFTDLTPCEITAIFSAAALKASQAMGMADSARACIVYEEAHSLVPEFNSVASKGDQNATAATARAILQGRKFGLGCLLVTQRTANVTKTILNQCNSIFAMRTFDDTGKEFLGNYIGAEYARVLPSLKERHAVFFGKSSSCVDPVMIRLNDRDKFIEAFRER